MKLLPILGLMALAIIVTGCVSPETAAKLDAAKAEAKDIRDQIAALRRMYESGQLPANEVAPKLEALFEELKDASKKVEAYATAPEPWWEKVGYVLWSVLAVGLGRKFGIPGLAHGTKPVGFLNAEK